jgi:hypothetical protein
MVEYALVVALIVSVSATAIQGLTDASEDEVANEMDCVSTRPPPPSCQLRSVATTTTDPSATTSSSIPPTTTSSTTTTTAPPPSIMTWSGVATVVGTQWMAEATPVITQDGQPVEGATVRVRVSITNPFLPITEEISCVTDSSGTCVLSYTVPEDDLGVEISQIRFTVLDVEAPVAVDDPPNDLQYPKP